MKCNINAGDLASALRSIRARARANKAEILNHVRVETFLDGRLTLLAHDGDSSSEAFLPAEVDVAGVCCIPADPLMRLIAGTLGSATVSIEVDSLQVTIKVGRSRYKLPVLNAADFPPALSANGGIKFSVTKDDIDQLLVRPAAALDPKDVRPIASGVFLHDEDGMLCGAGYSSACLMRFETKIPSNGISGTIVPLDAISEISAIGAGELTISDRIIGIRTDRLSYSSKLIDARYPSAWVKFILPAEGSYVECDRQALLEALARLQVVSDFAKERLLDVLISGDELSANVTGSADGIETMECDAVDADGKSFCLQVQNLIASCKAARGDRIRIFIRGTTTDPIRIVDLFEPDAVNQQMPCKSKRSQEAIAA